MISQSMSAIQHEFGSMGVQTVHLMQEALAKHEAELALAYDSSSRKITVLNSSDLSPSVLQKLLDKNGQLYKGWAPLLEERKIDGQNLQISLWPSSFHGRAFSCGENPKNAIQNCFNKDIKTCLKKDQIRQGEWIPSIPSIILSYEDGTSGYS